MKYVLEIDHEEFAIKFRDNHDIIAGYLGTTNLTQFGPFAPGKLIAFNITVDLVSPVVNSPRKAVVMFKPIEEFVASNRTAKEWNGIFNVDNIRKVE